MALSGMSARVCVIRQRLPNRADDVLTMTPIGQRAEIADRAAVVWTAVMVRLMLDLTVPAVLAYTEQRTTRDSGGIKHAVIRFGDATAICGVKMLSYGEPAPRSRPPGMRQQCADAIYPS